MAAPDICTVPVLAKRAKADGLPISEYTIRRLIKTGILPARYIGPKAVVSYGSLLRYLSCADGCDNAPTEMVTGSGIRRLEVG